MSDTANIIVLGIGNILLGDEGLGVRTIERLQRDFRIPPHIELVDGGTAGIDLLGFVRKDTALIIVDCIKPKERPGRMIRLEGSEVPTFLSSKISPHQLGLSDLLAAAHLIDRKPEKLVFLGMEPKSIATGLTLTAEIENCLPQLVTAIVQELRALGTELTRNLN